MLNSFFSLQPVKTSMKVQIYSHIAVILQAALLTTACVLCAYMITTVYLKTPCTIIVVEVTIPTSTTDSHNIVSLPPVVSPPPSEGKDTYKFIQCIEQYTTFILF